MWWQLSQPLDQTIAHAKTSVAPSRICKTGCLCGFGQAFSALCCGLPAMAAQHYDKLRGTEGGSSAAGGGAGTSGTKDISALLAEEVAELKDRSKQRFKKHDTGVKGCFLVTFPADEGTAVRLREGGGGVAWMRLAGGTRRSEEGTEGRQS